MRRAVCLVSLLVCLVSFLSGCRRHADLDRQHIRLILAHPNLGIGEEVYLFAVPKRLGYFAQEGLGVQLKMGSSGMQAGQVVATHGAEFGTLLAEAVLAVREQHGHLVAFDQLKTNNGYSVSVLPGSPIHALSDLAGKNVGFAVLGSGAAKILEQQFVFDGMKPSFIPYAVGSGPAVATALRAGQVDAIVMWDAMEQILENNGLALRHIEIPIQDTLAGYQLATTQAMIDGHPDVVAAFCRAVSRGLHFALADPEAAVSIFYDEFPTTLPQGVTRTQAVVNGGRILRAYFARSQRGVPFAGPTGVEVPARWQNTDDVYHRLGILFASQRVTDAYTNRFSAQCNDFDHAAIEVEAKHTIPPSQGIPQ